MTNKIRRDNVRSRLLHRCMDVGINWAALAGAYLIKENSGLGVPSEPLTVSVVIHTFVVVALIWLLVGSGLGSYTYKRPLFATCANLILTLAITVAFFNTYIYFVRPYETFIFPRYVMLLYAINGAVLLTVSRIIKSASQKALHRRGWGVSRVLIVGTGPAADRLAQAFRINHALGYRFMGYVTLPDQPAPATDHCGTTAELEAIIERSGADEIIVALPGREHQEILNIAHRCQSAELRLRVVPDLFDVIMVRATLTEIEDIPLIGLRDPVIAGYQSMVKRVFDVIAATISVIVCAPLMAVIAVAIRIDSRGPIIFRQARVGENGKVFNMYKFRSMVFDAERQLGQYVDLTQLEQVPVYKIRNDPRVTRLGRFLRRTSLDELPQLFNVLRGEMSMVGPRPEELKVVKYYQLWHRKRLSVKPGITGPMQVSGRGDLPLDDRIKLELMYINQYSILEDIKYLLKTVPAVLRARGAY